MTEREKIIALARKCGATGDYNGYFMIYKFHFDELEAFYHAAQKDAFEQAALKCEEIKSNWNYCADEIRQLGKETK